MTMGLVAALDGLQLCVGLLDADLRLLEQSSRFRAVLSSALDRDALLALIRSAVSRIAPAQVHVRPDLRAAEARDASYIVRASIYLENTRLYLVHIDLAGPNPALSDEQLRRAGLTIREVQVARLLAVGKSNRVIAQALGISPHTTRHHTERVLAKLKLHSRNAVASRLLTGAIAS